VLSPDALIHEMSELEAKGVPARERLMLSEACPLILPYHVALDQARERARGASKIGTTGRGIGPAYEDKVARRAIRLEDIFHREQLAAKLGEVLDFHNFVLRHYFQTTPIDFQEVLDRVLGQAEILAPMVGDVPSRLMDLRRAGANLMFEGAQGTLLDIDHGTYPYVTSSNTTAGGASTGTGVGPLAFDYILGITKAYTTRVGGGPFPTELDDEIGTHLAVKGHEVGATTGRARRCGWFDAVALRRAVEINSISGLCLTKLDVLDGIDKISICVGYELDGHPLSVAPLSADTYARCIPVYEEMSGWQVSTVGVRTLDGLPENARRYIRRIEELSGVPVDIISTGPDRDETIVLRDPYDA
jgi:adenylosuccinate synthase